MSISPLTPLAPLSPRSVEINSTSGVSGSGFGDILQQMIASNAQANQGVDQAISSLATGQAQDLHTVSLAVAQADLNFRLILEIRNRLTEAFQEIMRIQV